MNCWWSLFHLHWWKFVRLLSVLTKTRRKYWKWELVCWCFINRHKLIEFPIPRNRLARRTQGSNFECGTTWSHGCFIETVETCCNKVVVCTVQLFVQLVPTVPTWRCEMRAHMQMKIRMMATTVICHGFYCTVLVQLGLLHSAMQFFMSLVGARSDLGKLLGIN